MKSQSFWFKSPSAWHWVPTFRTGHGRKLVLAALLLAGLQPTLLANTNWYVRSDATGSNNGTDWNNAWTNVTGINWNSVSAGDSIWIAGGSYGRLTIGKSGLSGNPINILRVRSTNSAPTSAAGWSSSFDSGVLINRVTSTGYSYWTIDGQIPHTGLVITNTSVTVGHGVDLGTTSAGHISLKNLTITGGVVDNTVKGVGDNRCFNANFFVSGANSGLYIGDCTFQQYPTLLLTIKLNDIVIERCKFWKNYHGTSIHHPNIWGAMGTTNVVFRNNEITEWLSEGIMLCFVGPTDSPNDSWEIYNNVWHDEVPGWHGRILESQSVPQYRIKFYNNTAVNVHFGIMTGAGGTWHSSCISRNNIGMNVAGFGLLEFAGGDNDYNLSDKSNAQAHGVGGATTSIFANYAAKDYRIVETIGATYPRDKGMDLGSPYNVDFRGNFRTGTWDIGAYQYQPRSDPARPASPKALRLQPVPTP